MCDGWMGKTNAEFVASSPGKANQQSRNFPDKHFCPFAIRTHHVQSQDHNCVIPWVGHVVGHGSKFGLAADHVISWHLILAQSRANP